MRDVEDVRIRLVSSEDLAVMKILAGRTKDIEDVGAIVAALGQAFDFSYVRLMLGALQEALG